jgi:hypothetical protein
MRESWAIADLLLQGGVEGDHAADDGRRQQRVQGGGDEGQVGGHHGLHVHPSEAVQEGLRQALAPAALLGTSAKTGDIYSKEKKPVQP